MKRRESGLFQMCPKPTGTGLFGDVNRKPLLKDCDSFGLILRYWRKAADDLERLGWRRTVKGNRFGNWKKVVAGRTRYARDMSSDEYAIALIEHYARGYMDYLCKGNIDRAVEMALYLGITLGHLSVRYRHQMQAIAARRGSFTGSDDVLTRINAAVAKLSESPRFQGKRVTARHLKELKEFSNYPLATLRAYLWRARKT